MSFAFIAGLLHLCYDERFREAWSRLLGASSALELSNILRTVEEELAEEGQEFWGLPHFWGYWDSQSGSCFNAHLDRAHWLSKEDLTHLNWWGRTEEPGAMEIELRAALDRAQLGFFYQEERGPHAGLVFWWPHEGLPKVFVGEHELPEHELRRRVEESVLATAHDAAEDERIKGMSFEDKVLY